MKHDYKVQIVLERGDELALKLKDFFLFFFSSNGVSFDMKGEGVSRRGFEPGSKFFFLFFFFLLAQKCRDCTFGLTVTLCVSVLFPRIEPVGKPYREVCLQTLLWPWKVHRPSSWSLLPSEPQNVYSSSTSHYLSSGQIWERLDDKWQRNRVTQAAVKKKNKMKKNKRQNENRKVGTQIESFFFLFFL